MKELFEHMDELYGKLPSERVKKLQEEVNELADAIKAFDEAPCLARAEIVYDELADVAVVLHHLLHITQEPLEHLLAHAEKKIRGRETDPNYMRHHEHKER